MIKMPRQLPLFPEENPMSNDLSVEGVPWSYSRRSLFERCPRQYYYEYFGAKKSVALADPDKTQIQFLSELPSRHLRAGDIVHTVIRVTLRKAQNGEYWDADRIVGWGQALLRKDREHSRSHPDGDHDSETPFPPKLSLEYHYRMPEVETLYDEIDARLVNALTNFATSPVFETFRAHGRYPDSLVEKRFTLKALDCKIDGQVDLAYQTGDLVTVVDWKLGQEDGIGEDSLQMAAYALWAMDFFAVTPYQISVYKSFLGSNSVTQFSSDLDTLEAAKVRIIQDAERLASVQDYGERGIAAAFTPCYQELICKSCPFQRLCYGN